MIRLIILQQRLIKLQRKSIKELERKLAKAELKYKIALQLAIRKEDNEI